MSNDLSNLFGILEIYPFNLWPKKNKFIVLSARWIYAEGKAQHGASCSSRVTPKQEETQQNLSYFLFIFKLSSRGLITQWS